MRNKLVLLSAVFFLIQFTTFGQKTTNVEIIFQNFVGEKPLVLYDEEFINVFEEHFVVNKFKYYLSHIAFNGEKQDEIYLIDEKDNASKTIAFHIPSGKYSFLSFQIGVDSVFNVSGAQTGVLDPRNDMFWTWNTGYIMAKLEGTSKASNIVNGKFEYHIGGFGTKDNVLQSVRLPLEGIEFKADQKVKIWIKADINAWFDGRNEIKIAERPAINSPGKNAVRMSANYANMFSIVKIERMP